MLMIGSSADHPKLKNLITQSEFLAQYPQSYYLIKIELSKLPISTLKQLKVLENPQVNYYLLRHLVDIGAFEQALPYWSTIPKKLPTQQLESLIEVLLKLGKWHELTLLSKHIEPFDRLDSLLQLQAGKIIENIDKQQIKHLPVRLLPKALNFHQSCKNTVLLLADHLEASIHLQKLRAQYNKRPEPSLNSFCMSEVFYVGSALNCKEGFNGFAFCNLNQSLPHADYQIIMTKRGLANVRNKQMTLSLQSDIDVLIHELMHFSGFEDEYAVYGRKAKWLCNSSGLKAPNLYVGTVQSAPVDWSPAKTCEKGRLKAFKPSSQWSKMQYQELPLTEQYRQLWRKKIVQDWQFKQKIQANKGEVIIN